MRGKKTAADTLNRLRDVIRKQAERREREESIRALAGRFDVSPRTVDREIKKLGIKRKRGRKLG